jgi:hypothetical protein
MAERFDVKKAEELCEKATPGPWKAGRPDMATIVDGVGSKWIYSGDQYVAIASGHVDGPWKQVMNNATFIAESRSLIPEAIAEIQLLRAIYTEAKNSTDWISTPGLKKAIDLYEKLYI